ncbi:MAG: nitroreductase family protein [Bacteroidetes bacterium]|nr:nitroreductase family protein [Bacteroidota bacterium]
MTDSTHFIPFTHPIRLSESEAEARSIEVFNTFDGRRTVRDFSSRPVPISVIENCLRAASTAPSGAHKQPWHFAVVSDPAKKRAIRIGAEAEEQEFYGGKAPQDWIEALRPFGTDAEKPFLETAPFLIGIFARNYDVLEDGSRAKNYYVAESVGIATGMLISALHQCGLSTLTHTPSPMGFLNEIMERPAHERAIILLVVGYPSEEAKVPLLRRKELHEFATVL